MDACSADSLHCTAKGVFVPEWHPLVLLLHPAAVKVLKAEPYHQKGTLFDVFCKK